MKLKFKSVISLCLAIVIMTTMFSGMAFADGTMPTDADNNTPIEMLEPEPFDITSRESLDALDRGMKSSSNANTSAYVASDAKQNEMIKSAPNVASNAVQILQDIRPDRAELAKQNNMIKSTPNVASGAVQILQSTQLERVDRAMQKDVIKSAPNVTVTLSVYCHIQPKVYAK